MSGPGNLVKITSNFLIIIFHLKKQLNNLLF